METRSLGDFQEPYVRGPHMGYFVGAMAIALSIVMILLAGFVWMMRVIYP